MNRIAAASGAFNAFGLISCILIVKRIWTAYMEFVLYTCTRKLIIIIMVCADRVQTSAQLLETSLKHRMASMTKC